MSQPLTREFYDRDTVEVAKDLLGCLLVREVDGQRLVARIVETEAYVGPHDRASHSSRGITERTKVMYGPPGHAYVYFIYGMHFCLNAVTEREGHGSAVLLRALEPVEGIAAGCRTDGPGRLTRALSIDKGQNELDLTIGKGLWFEAGDTPLGPVQSGKRIGVDYAGEWAERPWRFWVANSEHVSVRPRGSTSRRTAKSVVEATAIRPAAGEEGPSGP